MRLVLAGFGGAMVLAALAYLVFARPVAPPPPPAPVAIAPAAPAPVAAVAKPADVAKVSAPDPPPEPPSTLAERAKAGEVAAMREFGLALLPCRKPTADAMFSKAEAGASPWELAAGSPPQACDALPAGEREHGLAWIERAAVAGDAAARRTYLEHALEDHFLPETVAADIDELVRRRDLARGFVREAAERCEPDAFAIQRGAFTLLGMDDAVERIAVLHAERLGEPDPEPGSTGSEAALEFARESEHVDVDTLAEAERRGAAMHARCAH